jgi:hypothetical protein
MKHILRNNFTKNKILILISIFIPIILVGAIFGYFNGSKTTTLVAISESQAIEIIKNQFPEFKEYPSNNLPPKSIKTEKGSDGWYVAFVQEGSGRPIIDASCFLVESDKSVTQRKYVPQDDTLVGDFSTKECRVIESIVGGDEDEHGCKGSAGYYWCQEKQKCLRSWEEPCEENSGSLSCGIENCHGLDIVCGKNPAQMCTEMYQLGDKCRQFAECGAVNGACQQIENPRFTACKLCAQKCDRDFPNDPDKAFTCESNCGE